MKFYNEDDIKWITGFGIKSYYYKITSDGFIFVPSKRNLVLKPFISNSGYARVNLAMNNKPQKKFSIHRLVALTFIPKPDNMDIVNHKDGNKLNNSVDNLEWSNESLNMIHAYDNQLAYTKGTKCHLSKPDKYPDELVHKICKMIANRYKTTDIIYELDLVDPTISKSSKEFQNYKHYINDIRKRKQRRDITSQYVY